MHMHTYLYMSMYMRVWMYVHKETCKYICISHIRTYTYTDSFAHCICTHIMYIDVFVCALANIFRYFIWCKNGYGRNTHRHITPFLDHLKVTQATSSYNTHSDQRILLPSRAWGRKCFQSCRRPQADSSCHQRIRVDTTAQPLATCIDKKFLSLILPPGIMMAKWWLNVVFLRDNWWYIMVEYLVMYPRHETWLGNSRSLNGGL